MAELPFQHVDNLKHRFLDVARPNMFEIEVVNNLPGLVLPPKEIIRAAVKTAGFPSATVGDLSLTRMGVKYPMPGDLAWGEQSVTFFNDVEFLVYNFFQEWRRLYLRRGTSNQGGIPKNAFLNDIQIIQLYGDHRRAQICTLKHAWPSVIGDIQLDHESENASESFQVTFSYVYANWSKAQNVGSSQVENDLDSAETSDSPPVPDFTLTYSTDLTDKVKTWL